MSGFAQLDVATAGTGQPGVGIFADRLLRLICVIFGTSTENQLVPRWSLRLFQPLEYPTQAKRLGRWEQVLVQLGVFEFAGVYGARSIVVGIPGKLARSGRPAIAVVVRIRLMTYAVGGLTN